MNVSAQQIKIVCNATEYIRESGKTKIARSIEEAVDTIFILTSSNTMTVTSYRMGWKLVFYRGGNVYQMTSDQMGTQNGEPVEIDLYSIKKGNQVQVDYVKCTNQFLRGFMTARISANKWYYHNIDQGYVLNEHTGIWEDVFSLPGKEIKGLDSHVINSLKKFGDSNQTVQSNNASSSFSTAQKLETVTLRGTGLSFKMVYVAGGDFNYQNTYNRTVKSFYIGQTEVTQSLWKAVMKTNPSKDKGGDNFPVNNITYWQALTFCRKLSSLTGRKFRLPDDVEWEYAATGGQASQGYLYAGSNNPLEVGWFSDNSQEMLHAVGLKKPNELDIYDMSGNVKEMCNDYIDEYHSENENLPGCYRRARGGSWEVEKVLVKNKSYDSYSDHYQQGFGTRFVGFRVIME